MEVMADMHMVYLENGQREQEWRAEGIKGWKCKTNARVHYQGDHHHLGLMSKTGMPENESGENLYTGLVDVLSTWLWKYTEDWVF